MKRSSIKAVSQCNDEVRSRDSGDSGVFVMCIDRARLIKQLLDVMDDPHSLQERRN